jgi:hypothetical protein
MNDKTKVGLMAGVILVLAVAAVAFALGYAHVPQGSAIQQGNQNYYPPQQQQQGNQNNGIAPAGIPPGTDFKFLPYHTDSITGTAKTEGTHVNTVILQVDPSKASGFSDRVAASTTAVQLPMLASDGGYVYFTAKAASGQAWALDTSALSANGGNVQIVGWMDYNGDSSPEWVLKYDTSKVYNVIQTQQVPTLAPALKWFQVNGAVTLTAPTAVTGIGASATDQTYNIKVTATAQKAQLYREIQVRFNTTSTSKFDPALSYITTPFGTYSLGSATSTSQDGTYQYFYIRIANEQNTAKIVTIPTGGSVDRYDTMKIHWTLATNDVIQVGLKYVTMSATNSAQESGSGTYTTWNNSEA